MHKHTKNTLVAFLITTLLAPGFFFGISPPKQAEAQELGDILGGAASYALCEYGSGLQDSIGGMLGDLGSALGIDFDFGGDMGGFGGGSGDGSSVPVYETNPPMLEDIAVSRAMDESLIYKECTLDPFAWVVKAVLIDVILQEIMYWVNTGFENGPVFLRDPSDFAKQLAWYTFDMFISNTELREYLCEPFSADVIDMVRYVGNTSATFGDDGALNQSASCTLEDVLGNTANALYGAMVDEGDLSDAGITGAMALLDEGNNVFSAYFNTQALAATKVSQVNSREMSLLSYADGFFSDRCVIGGVDGVCTPGQIISRQVDDWLGGSLSELETADEVSEIVSNLVAGFVNSIFRDETKGLLRGGGTAQTADTFYDSMDGVTTGTANVNVTPTTTGTTGTGTTPTAPPPPPPAIPTSPSSGTTTGGTTTGGTTTGGTTTGGTTTGGTTTGGGAVPPPPPAPPAFG